MTCSWRTGARIIVVSGPPKHGKDGCSAYSIFNYLMRQYQVNVPLRTQGWINDKLCSATIKDGRCVSLQFLRAKNSRGSKKFFECMDALILVVTAQALEQVS